MTTRTSLIRSNQRSFTLSADAMQRIITFFRDKLTSGMGREFVLYASSTVLMQASKFGTNLFVAALIGPTSQGWWNSLQPFVIYSSLIQLGVLNGMNRQIPYYMGRGEEYRAERIRRVSLGVVVLTVIPPVFLALTIGGLIPDNPLLSQAVMVMAVAILAQQWFLYKRMLLFSAIRFDLVSVQQVSLAVFYPLLCLLLAWQWGLPGFILAQGLVNLILVAIISGIAPFGNRMSFDWRETRQLIGIGLPIMLGGFLYDLMGILDRWIILAFLGATEVGYYTLAILSLQVLTLLPNVVVSQFYPRMSRAYGESHSYRGVRHMLVRSAQAATVIIWPLSLAFILAVDPFVRHYMPDYVEGILAARIAIVGIAFSGPVVSSAGNFLNAVGKGKLFMLIQGGVVIVEVLFMLGVLLLLDWGLAGVAAGVAAARVVNMIGLAVPVLWLLKSEKSDA